jgi:hypothetical protein
MDHARSLDQSLALQGRREEKTRLSCESVSNALKANQSRLLLAERSERIKASLKEIIAVIQQFDLAGAVPDQELGAMVKLAD